ncbi:tetratricopeptide repeat protein 28-like [Pocillopora verrucosa]|uniref:tetratricopeptide repeat protein 28-like n=1 Tax=Pocillopora verrucosa TaxID=203993 RepID=UPI003341D285
MAFDICKLQNTGSLPLSDRYQGEDGNGNLTAEAMTPFMSIVLFVALFLLNSDRFQKAVEICSECLILLNSTDQNIGENLKAKEYFGRALAITTEIGDRKGEAFCYGNLATVFKSLGQYDKAKEYLQKALVITTEIGDRKGEASCYGNLGSVFKSLGQYEKAKEYYQKALVIRTEIGDRQGEATDYGNLGTVFNSLGQYDKAKEYYQKALVIKTEIGDIKGEASHYGNLGTVFLSLCQHDKAKEYLQKALVITTEIGDRKGEASCYGNLGTVFYSLGQYDKAKEYHQKALVIRTEIGDRQGKASCYGNLGNVFESLGQYEKAKEYYQKALVITTEIGDRQGEGSCYGSLGAVFVSLGQYDKAKEYLQKALVITTEIGDRQGEATDYRNLGTAFQSLGQYDKAKEYLQKALVITIEIGDRKGEASCYGNLGIVFNSLGQYDKAKEYHQKALVITTEIGDRKREALCYADLGTVFHSLGQYKKAKEYHQKTLVITTEIGDRKGEASCYGNLGAVFLSLGQYDKAKEYHQKALVIRTEIGDRKGEAADYGNLGTVFNSLGQYDKAKEYLQKALVIRTEIGDRKGEATDYGNLGTVFQSLGQYDKAKQYLQKGLVIATEIGDKEGEAAHLANLGNVSRTVGDYEASEVCLEKALFISRDIGAGRREFEILRGYAVLYLLQNKIKDSLSCLHLCIEKYEELRYFLGANDEFKTSLLEHSGIFPYKLLCTLLCDTGNARDALYVEVLGRARGLSDLMAEKYSVETHIFANPQSWFGIENILRKKNNCTCLYISYFQNVLHLWILKTSGVLHHRRISVEENLLQAGLPKDLSLSQFLDDNFRGLGILPTKDCEDRSLNTINVQPLPPAQKSSARLRLVEEDEDKEVISSLSLCYKIFIAPVYDLLEEPEVIIVPDRSLYKVPFAALNEKEGAEYLSETHKIRVIPSLTTLKIIQDSPEGYHSNTGALIIGNPKVHWLPSLPCARKEAEMVGRLMRVPPLVEEKATKQAVLERIGSVSLIHFAAHGNAQRGEIALSPIPIPNNPNPIPPQEAYMLTMADVSLVKVRAKLVVLSCCHSGRGEITAEGVIGIARAFLGSGARSVLVALWAISDLATEQLMNRFYKHLVEGESASESLHQAMKWMRKNGSNKMSDWASFTLIGDDVRLEFDK